MTKDPAPLIESINAITLIVSDMAQAVAFYQALGFEMSYGGPGTRFTSFHVGRGHLNLMAARAGQLAGSYDGWGRFIIYVADVDAMYDRTIAKGLTPEFAPRDANWGERYFHIRDPDGHEVSFARPLEK